VRAAPGKAALRALIRASGWFTVTVIVNGQQTQIAEGASVSELIQALGLKEERLAVEVNRRIVRRSDWASTELAEGDKVEVVHFVGGGNIAGEASLQFMERC
jgi:thiamine biosynthesis protein ThiS